MTSFAKKGIRGRVDGQIPCGAVAQATRKQRVYIPLEYEPGVDMQMDWGKRWWSWAARS